MSSKPNLIPSKNALRALRNLAYAHPILLSGAVGSACCAAAASCEVQRKIRVAEKVVATKRTLLSVSNGKRSNRVARMIEAAEKGESFLLDPRSGQRRQRPKPRTYSTALAEKEEEDSSRPEPRSEPQVARSHRNGERVIAPSPTSEALDKDALDAIVRRTEHEGGRHRNSRHESVGSRTQTSERDRMLRPHERLANTEKHVQDSQPPLVPVASRAWTIDSQRPHNSASAERVKVASMRSMKSSSHHAYGRTRVTGFDSAYEESGRTAVGTERGDKTNELWDTAADKIQTSMGSGELPIPKTLDSSNNGREDADSLAHSLKRDLDTGPVYEDFSDVDDGFGDTPAVEADLETEQDYEHEQLTGSAGDMDDELSTDPFQWQFPETDFVDVRPKEAIEPGTIADLSVGLGVERGTFSYFTHLYQGAEAPPAWNDYSHSRGRSVVGVGHWSVAGQEIRQLVEAGRPRQAAALYHEHYEHSRDGLLPSTAKLLLPTLLSDESTHQLAVQILFTDDHAPNAKGGIDARLWRRTGLYLREFCGAHIDAERWKAQAETIICAARDDGQPLHGRGLESVVKALCALGRAREAEQWIKDMTAKYGLTRDFTLDEHITIGYARSNDWSSVNRMMQALQEEGIPRIRPYWFSYLFAGLLDRHLKGNTLESTYDYLIHAMGYWRLAPTRNISCTIIAGCIEAGDHLHLHQWIEAVRAMWPRLDIGTGSRALAESLSRIWDEQRVTCEHIERACSAMAFGAISDPFSAYLRAIIMEHVKADLRRQISDYEHLTGRTIHLRTGSREDFASLVHRAEACTKDQSISAKDDSECQYARDKLSRQLKAIWRLFRIMAGEATNELSLSDPDTDNEGLLLLDPVEEGATKIIPAPLKTPHLPHAQKLWPLIGDHYLRMRDQGRPVDHDALEHVVESLQAQSRPREAAELLESMCRSPFVNGKNGKVLPSRLYETYLNTVSHIGETKHCQRAMWAVLDASREVLITPTMLLRASICETAAKKYQDDRRYYEIRYLVSRMRKTRYIQMGRPLRPDLLPAWKTWDERIRKVTKTASFRSV